MQTKIIEKYFFFGLLLTTFIFTFLIFRPFWIVLVLGASMSIVLYPIYEWFRKGRLPSWLSSLLVVLFFIIIICGPLFGVGIVVFNQSQHVYHNIISNQGNISPFIERTNNSINRVLPVGISFDLNSKISNFISFLSNNVAEIFSTTLSAVFSFILLLLSIFYFLKDGVHWKKALIKLSPLSDANNEKILKRLSQTISGVLRGYLLIALMQGTLMGIGLYIFGVPNPALWAVIAGIASIIPPFGTGLVSVPAIIFLYTTGNKIEALGLLIWATALIGSIDNFVSPIIVSKKIQIPPFLILFSVLGGISLLGPVGILIGPLVVSLLYTLVSIYKNEFQQNTIL